MYPPKTELIERRLGELAAPENPFEGVRLPKSFALPDNILLFHNAICTITPIAHYRYTLVFPLGQMYYYVDRQEFNISEGDLLLIPPYSRRFLTLQSKTFRRFFITFELPEAQSYLPQGCLNHLSEKSMVYLDKMFDLFPDGSPDELSFALYGFLTTLAPGEKKPAENHLSRDVAAAVEFINDNLHTPLENDIIAGKVNMSTSNLARKFKREMGMPLHGYISFRRLEFARYYLEKTDMSVEEIAEVCGFLSGASFSHFFFRHTGKSPLNYRKNHF
ncbi:MAG: helix-turn-helix transcriptional regulator [Lentisphaeria bacterium]|nr:helix-turn-helix transcriptional regulator [Lentisphaeria bacterium]